MKKTNSPRWDKQQYLVGAFTADQGTLNKLVLDPGTWIISIISFSIIILISLIFSLILKFNFGIQPLNSFSFRILLAFLYSHVLSIPIFTFMLAFGKNKDGKFIDYLRVALFLSIGSIFFIISLIISIISGNPGFNFLTYMYYLILRGLALRQMCNLRLLDVVSLASILFIIEFSFIFLFL